MGDRWKQGNAKLPLPRVLESTNNIDAFSLLCANHWAIASTILRVILDIISDKCS